MKKYLLVLSLLMSACGQDAYVVNVKDTRPNVLMVGDSISGGYTLPLSYIARNDFNIVRVTTGPEPWRWIDNCRNTTYTLQNLDTWLKWYPNNKVIIWNNGIWNAATNPGPEDASHYYTPPEQYENEIKQIAIKLLAASPRVIFLTTTQLSPSDTRSTIGLNTQFNDIAKRVLPSMGIEMHDLYDFTIDHPDWHVSTTDLHFNGVANEIIADWIAQFLGVTLK